MEVFEDNFLKLVKEKFKNIDFSKLNDYYKEVAKILPKDCIDYLNDLIYEVFFVCPIGTAFIGQITSKCTENLIYSDSDTSKQIFEFMLED